MVAGARAGREYAAFLLLVVPHSDQADGASVSA
jgi:hypothetical protein